MHWSHVAIGARVTTAGGGERYHQTTVASHVQRAHTHTESETIADTALAPARARQYTHLLDRIRRRTVIKCGRGLAGNGRGYAGILDVVVVGGVCYGALWRRARRHFRHGVGGKELAKLVVGQKLQHFLLGGVEDVCTGGRPEANDNPNGLTSLLAEVHPLGPGAADVLLVNGLCGVPQSRSLSWRSLPELTACQPKVEVGGATVVLDELSKVPEYMLIFQDALQQANLFVFRFALLVSGPFWESVVLLARRRIIVALTFIHNHRRNIGIFCGRSFSSAPNRPNVFLSSLLLLLGVAAVVVHV